MTRADLMTLGQVLDDGDAGLVVVYASDMADRVATSVTAARKTVRATTTVTADQLAADIRAGDESAARR
jgi:hypothetical protein